MSRGRISVVAPAAVAAARTAIVVPARNEARRIAACLESLAAQDTDTRPVVCLCVNNTVDRTAAIALEVARRAGLALVCLDTTITAGGVGRARRIGHRLIRRISPKVRAILSTDADCVADPGWVRAMENGLRTAPAVLGRIDVAAAELDALPPRFHAQAAIEAAYLKLSMEFERLMAEPSRAAIGLNTAGGANLGVDARIYSHVGGFRALPCGEDRDLVDRIIRAGHAPIRVPGAVVVASMRATGRAPGGMAAAIAERMGAAACRIDTALAPFDAMLARHLGGIARPRQMTSTEALRDLPALRDCVARLRDARGLAERRALLAAMATVAMPPALPRSWPARPLLPGAAARPPARPRFPAGIIP